jgi:phosphatidylglycerol:prolipoprotein diacylglycerol transferase
MGLSWGIGFYLTQYLFEKNREEGSTLPKLYLGLFTSAWIGAKAFFLLFSSQNKASQYLYADYFWFGGGFVFYGGLLFGLAFYLIYSFVFKKFSFKKSYLLIPGLIFGHAVGRVGCFLTGCCYGKVCDLPWKVYMDGVYRHPVQLYEAMALFILGAFSLKWINGKNNLFVFTNYLLSYSVIRFVIEFFRGDDVRGVFWFQLSTSQYISIGLFLAALIVRIFYKKRVFVS